MQLSNTAPRGKAERLSSVASSYFFLALGHRKNGKFFHFLGRSEKYYGIAISEEPGSPVHLNNRALVREAGGDFEKAFLDFEAAKKLCGGNGGIRESVEKNAARTMAKLGIEKPGPLAEPVSEGIYTGSHYS